MIGDRLTVGCLALNQAVEVQILLPEFRARPRVSVVAMRSGVVAVGSDAWLRAPTPSVGRGGCWFDSNPRNFFWLSSNGSAPAATNLSCPGACLENRWRHLAACEFESGDCGE